MIEKLEFQGKLWRVCAKVDGRLVDVPSALKSNYRCDVVLKNNYGCDLVIRNPQNIYLMLNEIIDVEYEEI